MSRGTCEECPWVRQNGGDIRFIGHSKKHGKKHNCHMIPREKRSGTWDTGKNVTDDTICVGCEQHFEKQKK